MANPYALFHRAVVSAQLLLSALLLLAPPAALAKDNNSYATMLQNNAMRQAPDPADDQSGRRGRGLGGGRWAGAVHVALRVAA